MSSPFPDSGFFANLKAKQAAKDLAKREQREKDILAAEKNFWPDEITRGIARRYQEVLGIEGVVDQMRHQDQKVGREECCLQIAGRRNGVLLDILAVLLTRVFFHRNTFAYSLKATSMFVFALTPCPQSR